MEFRVLRDLLPPVFDPEERRKTEAEIAEHLDLEPAIAEGLIRRWRFFWSPRGELRRLHLVPSDRVRRTPGLERIREMFLGEIVPWWRSPTNRWYQDRHTPRPDRPWEKPKGWN